MTANCLQSDAEGKSAEPMMRKALFPISVGSGRATSEIVLAALRQIVPGHEQIIVLIADRLHLYNKAWSIGEGKSLPEVMNEFNKKGKYLAERSKWIQRIRVQLGEADGNSMWRVLGVDDVTDGHFSRIYRNVVIMYHTMPKFRSDVTVAATEYCRRRDKERLLETHLSLSIAYVLEEIAINIRVRVPDGVQDEYYMGGYLNPLLNLYSDQYGVSVWQLAEMDACRKDFRFYAWEGSGITGTWRPCLGQ